MHIGSGVLGIGEIFDGPQGQKGQHAPRRRLLAWINKWLIFNIILYYLTNVPVPYTQHFSGLVQFEHGTLVVADSGCKLSDSLMFSKSSSCNVGFCANGSHVPAGGFDLCNVTPHQAGELLSYARTSFYIILRV
jgi:hypothetical protein